MRKYSEETKAAAMAALLTGQSVSSVAREYSIPKGTVSNWKNRECTKNGTQKKEIADLLLDYLMVNLETLRKQAEHFGDAKWLSRQTASEAAVLHGVMTDKAIRLLEALGESEADDTPPES